MAVFWASGEQAATAIAAASALASRRQRKGRMVVARLAEMAVDAGMGFSDSAVVPTGTAGGLRCRQGLNRPSPANGVERLQMLSKPATRQALGPALSATQVIANHDARPLIYA